MADIATDSKLRLLVLLPFPPRLDAWHGGGRVAAQLLARLATRHRVALLYLRAPGEPPADAILHDRCEIIEEVVHPVAGTSPVRRALAAVRLWLGLLGGKPAWVQETAVPAYARRLRSLTRTWRPDIVQFEYHVMGQYLGALVGCSAPRVLTQYEPGAPAARERWRTGRAQGRLLPMLDMLAWTRFERTILRNVQRVVVFTERDRQALLGSARYDAIVQIPLGVPLPEQALNPLGRPPASLLFVGNYVHPPNVEAAIRLMTAIFPRVREHVPGLMLYIVGDRPPPGIQELAREDMVVTGPVPDVTPYLDRATLVVVPLRLGGGMRVKVLEALAAGKAVVASPLAVEGLDIIDGEHVVLAETDRQFADAIVELLADPDRIATLAARGRSWAQANLGWEKPVQAYMQLYRSVIGK